MLLLPVQAPGPSARSAHGHSHRRAHLRLCSHHLNTGAAMAAIGADASDFANIVLLLERLVATSTQRDSC